MKLDTPLIPLCGPGRASAALSWIGLLAACVLAAPVRAVEIDAVHVFKGVHGGGVDPQGSLLEAGDGALWGTTAAGGLQGDGTIFRITLNGQFESMASPMLDVARFPVGDLVQTADGSFIGVATAGGQHDAGSIYRYYGSAVTAIYSFDRDGWGGNPISGLVAGGDGLLYGVLTTGLVYTFEPDTAAWHALALLPDTCEGYGLRMVAGADGNLYGAATERGASCVYRVNAKGAVHVVHQFGRAESVTSLAAGRDGSLYGTSLDSSEHCGSIFRMSLAGKVDHLHHFRCSTKVSRIPLPGLAQGADGTLVGSTYSTRGHKQGQKQKASAVWRMASDGSGYVEAQVHGAGRAVGTPLPASDGAFYATTPGGKYRNGTIARITP